MSTARSVATIIEQPNLREEEEENHSVVTSNNGTTGPGGEYHPEGVAGSMGRAVVNNSSMNTPPTTETRPPSSRSGLPSRKGSGRRPFGGFGPSMANSSRLSQYSNRSSVHAPSIASSAFFRPLSSSRLQAQRLTRPTTGGTKEPLPPLPVGLSNNDPTSRASIESEQPPLTPLTPRTKASSERERRALSSRGTEVTIPEQLQEDHDLAYRNRSPTGVQTVQSMAESTSPLQPGSNGQRPSDKYRDSRRLSSSFMNGFKRVSQQSQMIHHSDEKLSNGSASPGQEKMNLSKQADGKNYEYFTGNTVFFLGGRLQNTRDRPVNIATGLFVVVPGVLFFVFCAPYLWYNVSPAVPVIFGYLFYLCMSSFVHASVTDPGILPRNLHPLPPPDNEDPFTLGPSLTSWTMIKTFHGETPAMDVPTKYCKSCNIWRPPRAHHCRNCDNCIETQDHHCVWLNNCVGRRNYRYFFTFISSATILCLYLSLASLGQCLSYMNLQSVSFVEAMDANRVAFAMFLYGLLAIPYPISLVIYHLFLMGTGVTTREYLASHNFAKKDRHRPFNQGNWVKNWLTVLLRERTPTYLRFKEEYIEGDPRYGQRRGRRDNPLSPGQQGGSMEMGRLSNGNGEAFQGRAVTDLSK